MIRETARNFTALFLLLFVAALSAAPASEVTTTVADSDVEDVTLSTELKPPPLPEKEEHHYILFVINLFGVKNASGETSDEMFENEIMKDAPELAEPMATVFLIVEVDDDGKETDAPVDLDEIADDLRNYEGLDVKKIGSDGETKMLKVKFDKTDLEGVDSSKMKLDKMKKVRNKRTPCLKCQIRNTYAYPGGGGCGSGACGGGYPGGGGGYPGGGGGCASGGCGGGYPGGGGGYPGGGGGGYGNSFGYASASSKAKAGSFSWG